MESWVWWLLGAALLGVPLVLTAMPEFAMFAVGAGAAALTAGLGGGAVLEFVVFLAVSVGMLVFVRPVAVRQLTKAPPVDHDGGLIKIRGEVWTARTLSEGQSYEPGARVEVADIEGATALVL